jgi:hypothetical protein
VELELALHVGALRERVVGIAFGAKPLAKERDRVAHGVIAITRLAASGIAQLGAASSRRRDLTRASGWP